MTTSWFPRLFSIRSQSSQRRQRKAQGHKRRSAFLERLDERALLAAVVGGNPNELVQSGYTATELAQSLVGPGVTISNATFTGGATAAGSFNFTDPTVIGFGQGIMLSSGNVADVVGPNSADYTSTDYMNPGDADLTALSGFDTYDASVLEFDFVPTANQVVFQYSFASDEYPEWVNTPFNDVFAFYVNGTNYATVRQVAGDPNSAFVPVAVNNINAGNYLYPDFVPARPDLFRPNYVNPTGGPSAIDLELDGITHVLNFQAPVTPGVVNHMKLAIADASDGVYDSAVFIQAGSLVSNENPVADLSLLPQSAADPSKVTAIVEGEDPNGLALTYTINWGDGTTTSGSLDSPTDQSEKTATADHFYAADGEYFVTLTISNGSLSGTSIEDIYITGVGGGGGGGGGGTTKSPPVVVSDPTDQSVFEGDLFSFTASATGYPVPNVQWQVSTDSGLTFVDIAGATQTTYSAFASLADDGSLYQAVFTSEEGDAVTMSALLMVSPATPQDTVAPAAPLVALAQDSGSSDTDNITSVGWLALSGIEVGATVEYSVDGGASWMPDFTAVEGPNSVQVRQTDEAGNISDAALLDFLLDTQAPISAELTLANDSGSSNTDGITSSGLLIVSGTELDAVVEYSLDGGSTWSNSFTASEGVNTVQVRQTDLAGNSSGVTTLSFTLDTVAPAAPSVSLTQDTGSSASDNITNLAALTVSGTEAGASVEFSSDNGVTWTSSYVAKEGLNTVSVRQTDVAGNVSALGGLNFTLDTTPPQLKPTFSSGTQFLLVNTKGVTVSPNASDSSGIASQSAGAIDTTTAGKKSVTCTATDLAGNSASVSVSYVVGYAVVNVKPASGATFKKTSSIPVSFQLRDANGLLSDAMAASLASKIVITFDNQSFSGVIYNKKTHTFSFSLKPSSPTVGTHTLGIHIFANGDEVTTLSMPIKIV